MFDGGGGGGYSSASECCFADINTMARKKKSTPTTTNNNNNNKRRFSDEQIRSLEVIFESETKLEPTKKAQLAKDLGLQPRQVAIWFQNKRARWKSKQIEKDYGLLLSNYNNLASQFECLRKEKQSLLIQLQDLKNGVERNSENKNLLEIDQETAGNSSSEGESGSTKKIDFDANSISSKHLVGMLSDGDDISMKAEFMGLQDEEDDHELLKMVGPGVESTLTSSEDWGASLDSDGQNYDHQLWDFWC